MKTLLSLWRPFVEDFYYLLAVIGVDEFYDADLAYCRTNAKAKQKYHPQHWRRQQQWKGSLDWWWRHWEKFSKSSNSSISNCNKISFKKIKLQTPWFAIFLLLKWATNLKRLQITMKAVLKPSYPRIPFPY